MCGCLACARPPAAPGPAPADEVSAALTPAGFTRALRAAGGGRFAATTTFGVHPQGAAGAAADRTAITTTTELVVDGKDNFRLTESNDRDGGREIVVHGKEISVALKYGKPVKRPAQEPEPTRLLEEALGGPWAVWEIARRQAAVATAPAANGLATFRVSRSEKPAPAARGAAAAAGPLAAWRATAAVTALEGEIAVDAATKLPRAVRLDMKFTYVQGPPPGAPYEGHARVEAKLDEVGTATAVEPPVAAELAQRRRPVLEERALLGRAIAPSLGSAATVSPSPKTTPATASKTAPGSSSPKTAPASAPKTAPSSGGESKPQGR